MGVGFRGGRGGSWGADEGRSNEELGVKVRRAGGQGRAEGGGDAGWEKVEEVKPEGGQGLLLGWLTVADTQVNILIHSRAINQLPSQPAGLDIRLPEVLQLKGLNCERPAH